MGKFEFRKHGILLDIEGVQVTVPATVEYAKKLAKPEEETANNRVFIPAEPWQD